MKTLTAQVWAILATLALGFNLTPASAEPSSLVKVRDLDLRRSQDVATLYQRIERAAARVCADASASWDARRLSFVRKCTTAAIDDAVAHANISALTALHEAKRGDAKLARNSAQ